jgi:glycosyltransferase involved in cell wall biosynthesis
VTRIAHVATVDLSLRYLLLDQLLHLKNAGYDVVAISNPGPDVAHIEAAGIPHIPVRMTRNFTPLDDARALLDLERIFKRERFDIVHTHTPKPGLIGQLAARMAGVPVVVNTIHGFYFHDHMKPHVRRFYVLMERIAAQQSSAILSQNPEDIETGIRERIFARDQVELLGNGIDLQRFDRARLDDDAQRALRKDLGFADDDQIVGFVGRLVAEKGLPELFDAFARVRAEHPRARLLIVGPSDEEKPDAITQRAQGTFTGLRDDMPELYGLMDVLVLPSHREGFPRAPMEAAAMQVPCVVTDIRGCRETVVEGETGRFVPVRDPNALATTILELLQRPERARALGRNGRTLATQRFDQRHVFEKVEATYRRLSA